VPKKSNPVIREQSLTKLKELDQVDLAELSPQSLFSVLGDMAISNAVRKCTLQEKAAIAALVPTLVAIMRKSSPFSLVERSRRISELFLDPDKKLTTKSDQRRATKPDQRRSMIQ
jgi:hypothetical protein